MEKNGPTRIWQSILVALIIGAFGIGVLQIAGAANHSGRKTKPPDPLTQQGAVRPLRGQAIGIPTEGITLRPNRPTSGSQPGTSSQPLPRFSGINAPYWIYQPAQGEGIPQVVDDLIIHGITEVKGGLVNNGAAVSTLPPAQPPPAQPPPPAAATVATPTITPNGGSFSTNVEVSLSTATSGASIYFTTNNSEPTTSSLKYKGPFIIPNKSGSITVKAKALKAGLTPSSIATATFTSTAPIDTVATPVITPSGGTFTNESVAVELLTTTPGASIRYTTDGTEPLASSSLYNNTFVVPPNGSVIKAKAFKTGLTTSEIATSSPFNISHTDLVVEAITFSPASPIAGNTVTFSATVKNRGGINANASKTAFAIDLEGGVLVDTATVNANNRTTVVTWPWVGTAGTHTIEVCANAGVNRIPEFNQGNNCRTSASFNVTAPVPPPPPPPADLIIESINATQGLVFPYATVNLSITVKNQGTGAAGTSQTSVRLGSGNPLSYGTPRNVPTQSIAGNNATQVVTVTWEGLQQGGAFKICADENNTITESVENNNCALQRFNVTQSVRGPVQYFFNLVGSLTPVTASLLPKQTRKISLLGPFMPKAYAQAGGGLPSGLLNPVTIFDDLYVHGNNTPQEPGNLVVKGAINGGQLNVGQNNSNHQINGNVLLLGPSLRVAGNSEFLGNVIIGNNAVPKNLQVYGAIKASSIGAFTTVLSATAKKLGLKWAAQNDATCPSNAVLISCEVNFDQEPTILNNILSSFSRVSGNTCSVKAIQTAKDDIIGFRARAVCFNPNG